MWRTPELRSRHLGNITVRQTLWITVIGGLIVVAVAAFAGAWVGPPEIKAGTAAVLDWAVRMWTAIWSAISFRVPVPAWLAVLMLAIGVVAYLRSRRPGEIEAPESKQQLPTRPPETPVVQPSSKPVMAGLPAGALPVPLRCEPTDEELDVMRLLVYMDGQSLGLPMAAEALKSSKLHMERVFERLLQNGLAGREMVMGGGFRVKFTSFGAAYCLDRNVRPSESQINALKRAFENHRNDWMANS